jgi:hypothetical protein
VKRLTPTKLAAIPAIVAALVWYAFQVFQPPLPVTVQFRLVTGVPGFVLIFKNDSDHPLAFTATLAHPGQQEEKKFAIQVRPNGACELGNAQGWVGQSGDRISLESSSYRVWRGAIP